MIKGQGPLLCLGLGSGLVIDRFRLLRWEDRVNNDDGQDRQMHDVVDGAEGGIRGSPGLAHERNHRVAQHLPCEPHVQADWTILLNRTVPYHVAHKPGKHSGWVIQQAAGQANAGLDGVLGHQAEKLKSEGDEVA